MGQATQAVRAILAAYAAKDRAAAERLIAADFHFTSPLDNRLDRQAYFAICWPNSETMAGFEIVLAAEAGERVFVTYEARSSSGKSFRNTELHTVRGGQLVEVEVYFGWNLPHPVRAGEHRDP